MAKQSSAESVSSDVYSADYYLQRCGGVEFFHLYKDEILKPAIQLAVKRAELEVGMKILDVGCGRGELVAHLSKRGFDAMGVDYSADAIRLANEYFPGARFLCGDLRELNFDDASFDRIFFLGVIEHLTDEQIAQALNEFRRLLKPGGMVIMTTCTNSLYYKTWTYDLRRGFVKFAERIGIRLKPPSPPRTEEDVAMHVNEKNVFSLKRHFTEDAWFVNVEPRLNSKLCYDEIYGDVSRANFPLKRASVARQFLYKAMMIVPLLGLLITRFNMVILRLR